MTRIFNLAAVLVICGAVGQGAAYLIERGLLPGTLN